MSSSSGTLEGLRESGDLRGGGAGRASRVGGGVAGFRKGWGLWKGPLAAKPCAQEEEEEEGQLWDLTRRLDHWIVSYRVNRSGSPEHDVRLRSRKPAGGGRGVCQRLRCFG